VLRWGIPIRVLFGVIGNMACAAVTGRIAKPCNLEEETKDLGILCRRTAPTSKKYEPSGNDAPTSSLSGTRRALPSSQDSRSKEFFLAEIQALDLTPVSDINVRTSKKQPCALCVVSDGSGRKLMIKLGGEEIRTESDTLQLCHDLHFTKGLISIVQSGQTPNGSYYFAMPFLDGESLAAKIKIGASPEDKLELIRACAKVLRTLDEMHSLGVVHADIKPGNIVFDSNREPIIIDLGSAYFLKYTGTRDISLDFASTELLKIWKGEVSSALPASDLFSVGVILYEIISRTLPFRGDIQHLETLIKARTKGAKFDTVPNSFKDFIPVLQKLLAKDPTERFGGSALLAAEALERALLSANSRAAELNFQTRQLLFSGSTSGRT
jgi:serine/threonine protein kinase